jgi:phage-related protein
MKQITQEFLLRLSARPLSRTCKTWSRAFISSSQMTKSGAWRRPTGRRQLRAIRHSDSTHQHNVCSGPLADTFEAVLIAMAV